MSFKSNLAVKGAKYSRRVSSDDVAAVKDKILDKLQQPPKSSDQSNVTGAGGSNGSPYTHNTNGLLASSASGSNRQLLPVSGSASAATSSKTAYDGEGGDSSSNLLSGVSNLDSPHGKSSSDMPGGNGSLLTGKAIGEAKHYWQHVDSATRNAEDTVIIHVCDENQNISRDFCCKRRILVKHMKYFEKFLAENENGYDDIDISVHCDVEIFEWLMTYIHAPDAPPTIDKSILVSILISSEFLQMESLVELCVQQVASNLNDIIKLPIDLSCISERLINRIAALTHPKCLSETKDRKDKILTKLYKRRVELDFSRKGSAAKAGGAHSLHAAATATANRTIAASLTCCRFCGTVYLENYVNFLSCRASPPTIDFRGQLASRHAAIAGWSLTSYLKTLHSGGMGWDAIYWHVWAACIVFRVQSVVISALEVDRYTVEPDGLLIRSCVLKERDMNQDDESHGESEGHTTMSASSAPGVGNGSGNVISSSSNGNSSSNSVLSSIMGSRVLPPRGQGGFSLSTEDDCRSNSRDPVGFKLQLHRGAETWAVQHSSFQSSTTSLNPNRPPEVLTLEIYDLICTQMRFIVGLAHKDLIQRTMEAIIDTAQKSSSSSSSSSSAPLDFGEILWGRGSATSGESGRIYNTLLSTLGESSDGERRRGRSPARGGRASSREGRKQLHSLSKGRANSANNNNNNNNSSSGNMSTTAVNNSSSAGIAADAESDFTSGDASSAIGASADSDVETPRGTAAGVGGGNRPPLTAERRSRSQSSGHRATSAGRPSLAVAGAGAAAKAAAKKHAAQSSMDDQGVRYQQRGGSVGAPHRFHSTALGRQIAVLKSVPPEVRHRISSSVGPVSGVWLHLHPLQLQSLQHEEILHLVGENPTLPPNKRIEWELDIMREYDEKRMEKFAAFLISRRNAAMDAQFDTRKISQQFKQGAAAGVSNSNSKSSGTGRASMVKASGALAYYRDRGRQPGK